MPTKKTSAKKTVKPTAKKKMASQTKKAAVKKATTRAKATAKKTTAKKTSKKAATNKVNARKGREGARGQKVPVKKPVKDLVYASDQESFWVNDGEILNSLLALRDAFAAMDTDIYQFHAAGEQNDFSVWVDTVLCDGDCAADLAKAKTPRSAKTTVVRYLKLYSI